ncbi:DUF808 family protein [Pseudomonas rustica]|uniref:DUF808 family protein n=1 Tax=Pseudomonas rustica TaxID=2827099 RepID=UPI003CF07AC4
MRNHGSATTEPKSYEAKMIEGAITTDFVLSAEIVVITLNVVSEALKPSPTLCYRLREDATGGGLDHA